MVFPSVPIYLDPSNWNQQQSQSQPAQAQLGTNTNTGTATNSENQNYAAQDQLHLPPVTLTGRPDPFAPLQNRVPHPEPGLKCPRCNSTNTKFCYFNNYSLSQPRHFCRSCRRYWTRGGTLRNVPVGGGSRRNNKRNKSSSSSSNATSARAGNNLVPAGIQQIGVSLPFGMNIAAENLGFGFLGAQMQFQQQQQQQQQQFPFRVPMQMAGTVHGNLDNLNSRSEQESLGRMGNGTSHVGTSKGGDTGTWNIGLSGFDTSSSGNIFQ